MGRNLIRKGLSLKKMWGKSSCEGSFPVFSFSSAGYEHIVALSLTGALHQNAPLSGLIIMDSPFGRLDPDHKKRWHLRCLRCRMRLFFLHILQKSMNKMHEKDWDHPLIMNIDLQDILHSILRSSDRIKQGGYYGRFHECSFVCICW